MLRLMSSGPALGSVLTAQNLEPASDSMSPSLFAPLPVIGKEDKIGREGRIGTEVPG